MKSLNYFQVFVALLLFSNNAKAQFATKTLNANAINVKVTSDGNHTEMMTSATAKSLNYLSQLWFSATDSAQSLCVAAQMYGQGGTDFKPGPISNNPNAINLFNKVWKINKTTTDSFASGQFAGTVPASILNWPAHGDTNQGESYYLAPFIDVNGNGKYSPQLDGDYPCFPGDQALFYMFNDNRVHTQTGAELLGIEILGMTYAYNQNNFLDSVVFSLYAIRNRTKELKDFRIGVYNDFDLGNYLDDLTATFVDQNTVVAYNSSANDGGSSGFGANPPATGMTVLSGVATSGPDGLDNNMDGCIDGVRDANGNCIAINAALNVIEYWKLASNIYFLNTSTGPQSNPIYPVEFKNYMTGKWRTGDNVILETPSGFMNTGNGDGYSLTSSQPILAFTYPGNSFDTSGAFFPSSPTNWFESPSTQDDKRVISGLGMRDTLHVGDEIQLKVAHFIARDAATINSYEAANAMAIKINQFVDSVPACSGSALISVAENKLPIFHLYPNPARDFITIATENTNQKEAVVLNQYGVLVAKIVLEDAETTFYVNQIPAGIYFLNIGQKTEKFVVLK